MMLRRLYARTHVSNAFTASASGPRGCRGSFIRRTRSTSMPPRGSYTPQIPHISRPPGEILVGADETRLLRAPVVFSFRGLQPVPPEALRERGIISKPLDGSAEARIRVWHNEAALLMVDDFRHQEALRHDARSARHHRLEHLVRDSDLRDPVGGVQHREDRVRVEGHRQDLFLRHDAQEGRVRVASAPFPPGWRAFLASSPYEPHVGPPAPDIEFLKEETADVESAQVNHGEGRPRRRTVSVEREFVAG